MYFDPSNKRAAPSEGPTPSGSHALIVHKVHDCLNSFMMTPHQRGPLSVWED